MARVAWSILAPDQCEKFISIMLLREFPHGHRRTPSRGDGGIDVIVPIDLPNRVFDVYQIKYFWSNIDKPQKRQIEGSIAAIKKTIEEKHITVREWHLTMPRDPTEGQQAWLEEQFDDSSVSPYWKGETFLEGLCAKYPEVIERYSELHHPSR